MPSAAFLTRIAALALLSATAFTAHAQDRQLVISDWGYSNEFLIPNLFEPFEQEHDVKIVLETGNAPDRLNRLRIRGGVDLIYLTDVFSQQGIDSESFAPIDPALLSNFDDLYEPAKTPQGDYGPAVTFGQYGIIYDTAKVEETITSWEDLWRPEFSRAIAMPGFNTTSGPLTVLMAAKRVGVDAFQDPDAAFASMAELEPNILKTYNSGSELTNLFTTGEVYIGLVQDFAFPAIKAAIPTVEWAEVSEGNLRMMKTLNIAALPRARRMSNLLTPSSTGS